MRGTIMKYEEKVLLGRIKELNLYSKEELIDIVINEQDTFRSLIDALTPKIK